METDIIIQFEPVIRQGIFLGIMLTICAGGIGWLFSICINLFNTIVGR